MIAAAQIMGLAISAAAYSLWVGSDEPEDERETDISGSWYGLSPKQKAQLLSQGEKPLAIRIGDKWISYKNTPFAMALALIGNMRDKQRFRGKQWDEEEAAEHIVSAWLAGTSYMKDLAMVDQLSQILGISAIQNPDEIEDANKKLSTMFARSAVGFIPGSSLLREIDTMLDPSVYRPNAGIEYWLRHIPFARRAVGPGPALNALGEPIENAMTPMSRWMSQAPGDPVWDYLAKQASKGVFLPVPAKTATIVDRSTGTRRQMTPEEFYQYQERAGKLWKRMLESNLPALRRLNAAQFDQWLDNVMDDVHSAARAQVR
jgi:hypothetical protein